MGRTIPLGVRQAFNVTRNLRAFGQVLDAHRRNVILWAMRFRVLPMLPWVLVFGFSAPVAVAQSTKKTSRPVASSPATDRAAKNGSSHTRRGQTSPKGGANASFPSFFQLSEGASRLSVELSSPTSVAIQKGPRSITFVLDQAHVDLRNNTHALETAYYNTPVVRARLHATSKGVEFVVQLRADVTPTHRVVSLPNGQARLEVEFPAGVYASPATPPPGPPPSSEGENAGDDAAH